MVRFERAAGDRARTKSYCKPSVVFGEQVASSDVIGLAKPSRRRVEAPTRGAWLDTVFSDLESSRYACGSIAFAAASVGSPQSRPRLYWVADATGRQQWRPRQPVEIEPRTDRGCGADGEWSDVEWLECSDGYRRPVEPGLHPLASVVPARVERLRGYGNAICVPAASAFISAYLDIEAAV